MPNDFIPPKSTDNKPIKVEQAKEPPKEVLESTFSLADLPKNGDVAAPIQLPPKQGDRKDEPTTIKPDETKSGDTKSVGDGQAKVEPKVEPAAILKPPSKDKKTDTAPKKEPEAVKQIVPPDKNAKKERDFTGFSPEETTHLKAMSNEAFAYTSNLIKENKELAKLKDASFLQHPDAYRLTPDYQQAQQQIQLADVEAQAWRTALIECKGGRKFQVPKGFNKQTGELVMSEPMDGSEEFEVELQQTLNHVIGVKQQLQGKLENMGQTFKQRTSQDRQMVEVERSKRFAWVAKPEMLDWTIATKGGDIPIKQVKDDFKNLFPPYDRNTTGVEVASDLMVAFLIQDAELAAAQAGKLTVETKIEEVKRGEPSSDAVERESGGEVNGVKEFSLNGMPR